MVVQPSIQPRLVRRNAAAELDRQPAQASVRPTRLERQARDLDIHERAEVDVDLLGSHPELARERLVEVEAFIERLEQPDHRREALGLDQHLAEQTALVVAEQDARTAEGAVEFAHRDQVVVRARIDQDAPHVARPAGIAAHLLPRRQALGDPARATIVREPQVHHVAELVEAGAGP